MEIVKVIIGFLVAVAGIIGIIGSAIAMRFSMMTLVIMAILNILGIIIIPWFAGPFTLGAISTGLWMALLGFIMIIVSYLVAIVGTTITKV